jgi:hypothetical protein
MFTGFEPCFTNHSHNKNDDMLAFTATKREAYAQVFEFLGPPVYNQDYEEYIK